MCFPPRPAARYSRDMETELIAWLRAHMPHHPSLRLGVGDDAAVLSLAGCGDVVMTTDMLSDGVDFYVHSDDPRRIGRKALAVNLSDLAAMAARPTAAVVSIALPRSPAGGTSSLDLAVALYEGLLPLAAKFDLAIAGGDTNTHDGPLVISVTALGQVSNRGPLTRAGGRPGDLLLVTGQLGGSILGHHFDFTPRVREALLLGERYDLDAGIDISDGLALDLSRLAAESDCGAVVDVDRLPISAAARQLADRDGGDVQAAALRHALGDGEDFELLLAVPPDAAEAIVRDRPLDCGVTHIGQLVAGTGLWRQSAGGQRQPLPPTGWLH
jgi:thiamine-monophosphate kinase